MKKTFKFMAMALAAVVMAVGTVSCDPMDKDDDQQNEQTGGDQTGDENDKTPEITSTPDGALWSFDFMYAGQAEASAVLDLRASEESAPVVYFYCTLVGTTSYSPLIVGTYTVNPTDNESGTIVITVEDTNASSLTINYSGLTETSMTLSCESEVLTLENATATKTDESILVPTPSPDGKQWITAEPLDDGSAYCFDFGFTVPGAYLESNISLDQTSTAYYKFSFPESAFEYMLGMYQITPTDETSGEILTVSMYGECIYPYKDLTETSVKIHASCADMSVSPEADEYLTFVIPTQTIVAQ